MNYTEIAEQYYRKYAGELPINDKDSFILGVLCVLTNIDANINTSPYVLKPQNRFVMKKEELK